jgi:hypothetical protein
LAVAASAAGSGPCLVRRIQCGQGVFNNLTGARTTHRFCEA